MFFRYGSHQHPNDEVQLRSFEQIPRFSSGPGGRNLRFETLYRMTVDGELQNTTATTPQASQTLLSTKIAELVDAYKYDHKDAGLFEDNGALTRHALLEAGDTGNNMTGVQILARSWPTGDPAEYATFRKFSITFGGIYAEVDSQILAYHDEIHNVGDAGPTWKHIVVQRGPARVQLFSQFQIQHIVQSGFVTGYEGWPEIRVPPPVSPTENHSEAMELERIGPVFRGRKYSHYTMRWLYRMTSNVKRDYIPTQH